MKTITFKLLLVLTLSTVLFSCSSDEDGIYTEQQSTQLKDVSLSYTVMEYEILDLVNDYRVSQGLNSLKTLNIISSEAITHTKYMINVGEVSHDNFSDRHKNLVNNAAAKNVAENVAYGYSSAKGVVNAWIKSEAHRLNIVNSSYTDFGVSIKKDDNGRNYFTQIFIKR